MEHTVFFGLITAPIDNLFLLSWGFGMATFALTMVLSRLIDKYTYWFEKFL